MLDTYMLNHSVLVVMVLTYIGVLLDGHQIAVIAVQSMVQFLYVLVTKTSINTGFTKGQTSGAKIQCIIHLNKENDFGIQ